MGHTVCRRDVNAEELIEFTLFYLADESLSPDLFIQLKLSELLETNFTQNEKPILMTCSQIESYLG
ncbi:hypothetical protein [Bacillus fonticola]|uniref:hypothetical protein n=1 Tax=Bacillus fonticola TaxID=2728853 RepID=UPI001D156C68|nr:hypothetical protein [Bacillus fonticola]